MKSIVRRDTGEDWNDVDLLFSTQRPSLGTEPPLLSNDVLRLKKKEAQVHVETREGGKPRLLSFDGEEPQIREITASKDAREVVGAAADKGDGD